MNEPDAKELLSCPDCQEGHPGHPPLRERERAPYERYRRARFPEDSNGQVPAIPKPFLPVYDALSTLVVEVHKVVEHEGLRHELLELVDETAHRLDQSLGLPSKLSQAPGGTITSNEGVGMGSKEKVAQDGDTEAKEGFQPRLFTDSDGLQLERKVEDLARRLDLVERLAASVSTDTKEAREMAAEDRARLSRLGQQLRWNDLGNWKEPCTPPAPPPSAAAAEETSSGGRSCGKGTAQGAG